MMLFNAIVFLFLCDISKRFGVSALLLFGIEESLILVAGPAARARSSSMYLAYSEARTGHRCRSRHCSHCDGCGSRAERARDRRALGHRVYGQAAA
ncbi:MAG: hypothetical protein ACLTDR_02415 [Adlercreutzia equolifaciens]